MSFRGSLFSILCPPRASLHSLPLPRTEKAPAVALGSGFPGGEAAAASAEPRGDGSSQELVGKEAGDKQKRDPGGSTVSTAQPCLPPASLGPPW